jgi:hypothetical protein
MTVAVRSVSSCRGSVLRQPCAAGLAEPAAARIQRRRMRSVVAFRSEEGKGLPPNPV